MVLIFNQSRWRSSSCVMMCIALPLYRENHVMASRPLPPGRRGGRGTRTASALHVLPEVKLMDAETSESSTTNATSYIEQIRANESLKTIVAEPEHESNAKHETDPEPTPVRSVKAFVATLQASEDVTVVSPPVAAAAGEDAVKRPVIAEVQTPGAIQPPVRHPSPQPVYTEPVVAPVVPTPPQPVAEAPIYTPFVPPVAVETPKEVKVIPTVVAPTPVVNAVQEASPAALQAQVHDHVIEGFHPFQLLLPVYAVPEVPETVYCVYDDEAVEMQKNIMKSVKKFFGKDRVRLEDFKINARLYGNNFMDPHEYIESLAKDFGGNRALQLVPCLLSLQDDFMKRNSLLVAARTYKLRNLAKLEAQLDRVVSVQETSVVASEPVSVPAVESVNIAIVEATVPGFVGVAAGSSKQEVANKIDESQSFNTADVVVEAAIEASVASVNEPSVVDVVEVEAPVVVASEVQAPEVVLSEVQSPVDTPSEVQATVVAVSDFQAPVVVSSEAPSEAVLSEVQAPVAQVTEVLAPVVSLCEVEAPAELFVPQPEEPAIVDEVYTSHAVADDVQSSPASDIDVVAIVEEAAVIATPEPQITPESLQADDTSSREDPQLTAEVAEVQEAVYAIKSEVTEPETSSVQDALLFEPVQSPPPLQVEVAVLEPVIVQSQNQIAVSPVSSSDPSAPTSPQSGTLGESVSLFNEVIPPAHARPVRRQSTINIFGEDIGSPEDDDSDDEIPSIGAPSVINSSSSIPDSAVTIHEAESLFGETIPAQPTSTASPAVAGPPPARPSMLFGFGTAGDDSSSDSDSDFSD